MVLRKLLKLFKAFKSSQFVSPADFIQASQKCDENEDESRIKYILYDILQKEAFLEDISDAFVNYFKLRIMNRANVKVFVYFIIFIMDDTTVDEILSTNIYYLKHLLQFLSLECTYASIAKIGIKYFENEYIIGKMMTSLNNQSKLIKSVKKRLEQMEVDKLLKTNLTVPEEFKFHGKRRIPPPPSNTPAVTSAFKLKQGSKSSEKKATFVKVDIETIYKKSYDDDREKSKPPKKQTSLPSRLAEPKKDFTQLQNPSPYVIKPTKCPINKEVKIKSNITTTLREASHFLKSHEDEISKIDQIIKGGCNLQSILELENKERTDRQKQEFEDIQRKHLQGLLTHEEAILARQKLADENKAKALVLRKMKADMLKDLEEWRESEQTKLRQQVERSQELKDNVKESEKRLQESKMQQAKIQQYETKQLLQAAFKEKEMELSRKVELIKEIRTLHELSIKLNAKRDFDPTQSPNLGLLSEMSIAELQERLNWTKIKMQEDLEKKRQGILDKKAQQQQTIDRLKKFIDESKLLPKLKPDTEPIKEMSPEILRLKKLVEEKRSQRMRVS